MKKYDLELEQKSKELMVEKNFFMKKATLELIKVDSYNDSPLNKKLKF